VFRRPDKTLNEPGKGPPPTRKKLPVVTVAERDEAARLADLQAEATLALGDVAAAIKDGLMAF